MPPTRTVELDTSARHELPTRSLVALAVGGLRVRLSRSLVTTTSIVLAIAFLTYMGLANRTSLALARDLQHAEAHQQQASLPEAELQSARQTAADLRKLLQQAGVNIQDTLEGNPLDTWLIVMALLTCTVGIANAMLMSVTERIREIGTMKCLGAMDGLVIKLFLIESGLVGLAGALAGLLLGLGVALLWAGWQFPGYGLSRFPLAGAAETLGLSLLAGLALSVVGAVYPAVVAARMKPVDALRTDE